MTNLFKLSEVWRSIFQRKKNSKVKEDGECLLNERSSDLLQQKEFDNTLIFETVTTQEQVVLQEGDDV